MLGLGSCESSSLYRKIINNEYGDMIVLNLEKYASFTENIEMKLDEADRQAATSKERLSHDTVFGNVRSAVHDKILPDGARDIDSYL